MYRRYFKRLFDIVFSLAFLLLFAWLYAILAILIWIDDPGPVLFKQKRYGIHQSFFQLYKFRSMKRNSPKDIPTHLFTHSEQYITRIGRLLRKTSLDEIPQLVNILIGQMSLIGPRPALWNQEDLIQERERYKANDVKPGLTGWAQINGRDTLEITEKAKLDGLYAEKLCQGGFNAFFFDCRCFFGTFLPVLRGEGVQEGRIESSDEKGNDTL